MTTTIPNHITNGNGNQKTNHIAKQKKKNGKKVRRLVLLDILRMRTVTRNEKRNENTDLVVGDDDIPTTVIV